MKTILLVAALLSALLLTAHAQHALGSYTTINVLSNQSDSASCRIQLDSDVDFTSNTTNDYTNISQSYQPPSQMTSMPAGCAFQNLQFTSFFYNDSSEFVVNYTMPVHYVYDSNGNLMSSWVNTTVLHDYIASMNGTQCVYLKESDTAFDQYLCQINYGGLPIYWAAYGSGSGSDFRFGPFYGARSKWVLTNSYLITPDQYWARIDLNSSFPSVVADIYSSCGSNNKNFWSLQTQITVTASVDLAALLPENFGSSITQVYVIVKKNSATDAGDYLVRGVPMGAIRSGLLCWGLGVSWDAILPDMNYCANGCMVTFIFANSPDLIFVLQTTGIKTSSNLRG